MNFFQLISTTLKRVSSHYSRWSWRRKILSMRSFDLCRGTRSRPREMWYVYNGEQSCCHIDKYFSYIKRGLKTLLWELDYIINFLNTKWVTHYTGSFFHLFFLCSGTSWRPGGAGEHEIPGVLPAREQTSAGSRISLQQKVSYDTTTIITRMTKQQQQHNYNDNNNNEIVHLQP